MTGFIGHLDADCFYVSAERVRHPDLARKPVGVLGNNGACVIAKSYEMKTAKGVKSRHPHLGREGTLCPDGVYVKRDFYWYEVLSRQMLGIVGTFSPKVEYYSIDEFFFDARTPDYKTSLPDGRHRTAGPHPRDRRACPSPSGWRGRGRSAKLFSDTAKPFGAVTVLTRDHERELLARMPVTEISGIAGTTRCKARPLRHPLVPRPGRRGRPIGEAVVDQDRARTVVGIERHPCNPDPPRALVAQGAVPRRQPDG